MKGKRLVFDLQIDLEVGQARSKQIMEVGCMSLWFGSIADIDIEEEQMHLGISIPWFCLLLGRKRQHALALPASVAGGRRRNKGGVSEKRRGSRHLSLIAEDPAIAALPFP